MAVQVGTREQLQDSNALQCDIHSLFLVTLSFVLADRKRESEGERERVSE